MDQTTVKWSYLVFLEFNAKVNVRCAESLTVHFHTERHNWNISYRGREITDNTVTSWAELFPYIEEHNG
jgi:hypothetical protein